MKPEIPESKEKSGLLLPRWAIPIVWAVIVLIILVILPWVISYIGPHLGWTQNKPEFWNTIGLIAVALGLAMYAWCLVYHFRSYRTSVRLGFSPPHLVTDGPYQISRNPMYVSAIFAWIGWTVFYGSPAVFIALVLLWSMFTFFVIPGEEHQLEELFGADYRDYKRSVRRWIGRV